jgi:hypothetical protein
MGQELLPLDHRSGRRRLKGCVKLKTIAKHLYQLLYDIIIKFIILDVFNLF